MSVIYGNDKDEERYDAAKTKVCNVAQDIVYAVSCNRKLTPKHVALGVALHQATRSETMVKLIHSAGHIIGMDTIRHIDTPIATNILNKFEKRGDIFFPDDIIPYSVGKLILASCDNIDVLDETIDG
jgi:hypothetical protein